jgi:uncharacterized membrane protein
MMGSGYSGGLLSLIASVLCLSGLFSIRGVFSDLVRATEENGEETVERSAPMRVPEPAARAVAPEPTPKRSGSWAQQPLGTTQAPSKTVKKETSIAQRIDWEEWVGQKLLQKAGVLIVLVGMVVFLKYSFDNGWIEELGRVAISTVAAVVLLGLGEAYQRRYPTWAQAFTGGGLVLLYLTVWVVHVFYAQALAVKYGLIIPAPFALILYSAITAFGILASVRYKAQTIAWFAVLGGYATPMLIEAPAGGQTMLVAYLMILSSGLLALAWFRQWRYLNVAAFALTQLELFLLVYPSSTTYFPEIAQVFTAILFFLLFNALPLLYQFKLKRPAQPEDILLIVGNGLAVFAPVVDALGGIDGRFTGLVCMALAATYMAFSALSLTRRSEDESLVNTYLVGTVILIALALLVEMEREWVAAGWAPFSAVLVWVSTQVKRKGPWVCATILLVLSLFFLAINMPSLAPVPEAIWHPFTSNWAIQSYVVFASVLAWMKLSNRLPESLVQGQSTQTLRTLLHVMLVLIAFAGVTFEATGLDWTIDLPLAFAYLAFAAVAGVIFFFTESLVWFVAAFAVQIITLLFVFAFGDSSGLSLEGPDAVQPFLHAWSVVSVLALLVTFGLTQAMRLKGGKTTAGPTFKTLLAATALGQVWMHGSVEVRHLGLAYDWSTLFEGRVLSGWWIVFALAVLAYGFLKKTPALRMAGILLLVPPFLHDIPRISGYLGFYETILWTVLSLALAVLGKRGGIKEMLWAGLALLGLTAGIDMVGHLGDRSAGFVRSSYWAVAALVAMIAGFTEKEKLLRKVAMGIFGAAAIKLLIFDFQGLEVPVRIGASIATGLLMIGASYLYQRFDSGSSTPSAAKRP